MSENPIVAFNCYIRPSYIAVTPQFMRDSKRKSSAQIHNERNLVNNHHQGKVSIKATKKIRNAINWMVAAAPDKPVWDQSINAFQFYKIGFITLTLSADQGSITDHYFKTTMLRSFLNSIQYRYGVVNYVWKVEAQKNGNIHAHITVDRFIHWKSIRAIWNRVQAKEGLIDEFEAKHGHRDPNSTDVKAVRSVDDLAAYMAKYMTKSETDKRLIKGRLWGCSYALSRADKCYCELDHDSFARWIGETDMTGIAYQTVYSEPDSLGRQKKLAELFFLTPKIWAKLSDNPLKSAYEQNLFTIKTGVNLPPNYWDHFEKSVESSKSRPGDVAAIDQPAPELQLSMFGDERKLGDVHGQAQTSVSGGHQGSVAVHPNFQTKRRRTSTVRDRIGLRYQNARKTPK